MVDDNVTPYVDVYADYYFNYDDATLPVAPLLLPNSCTAGRRVSLFGVAVTIANGSRLSVGGEVGGLGSGDFTLWSNRGRAAVPL